MAILRGTDVPIALVLIALVVPRVAAQYPERPIRFIVGSSPGSTADIIARVLATELGAQMRQQVIVDNRPGAAGVISMDLIVKAPADGYTIGYFSTSMVVLRELYPKFPFDPVNDVQMVAQLVSGRQLLLVPSASSFNSVQALIDHAKANPDKLYYASGGNGSSNHLSGELFKAMSGTQIVQVPYKTIQQVITDLTGGRVQMTFDNLASALPYVRSGRLSALGVSSCRSAKLMRFCANTFGTRAVERGVSRSVLMQQFGHADERSTSRYSRAQFERVSAEMEAAFPAGVAVEQGTPPAPAAS